MDFSSFDTRKYRTLEVRDGYGEWARTYEETVHDLMDRRLLDRLGRIAWDAVGSAVDLACGTGRTGEWLRERGVATVDGVDITPEMLAAASSRSIYRRLVEADVGRTGLEAAAYDLSIQALADEHLPDLLPLYNEAARLTRPGGHFILVGYHPYFLMAGVVTHFHREDGEPVAIRSYVHLPSDHVRAAHAAGWRLLEMEEGVIDETWIRAKPKWAKHRNRPVSFVMNWMKP